MPKNPTTGPAGGGKKPRWTAEQKKAHRAAKAGKTAHRGQGDNRAARRAAAFGDRPERRERVERRGERPQRSDRMPRGERAERTDRSRGERWDRRDRPERGDRPATDRAGWRGRDERPQRRWEREDESGRGDARARGPRSPRDGARGGRDGGPRWDDRRSQRFEESRGDDRRAERRDDGRREDRPRGRYTPERPRHHYDPQGRPPRDDRPRGKRPVRTDRATTWEERERPRRFEGRGPREERGFRGDRRPRFDDRRAERAPRFDERSDPGRPRGDVRRADHRGSERPRRHEDRGPRRWEDRPSYRGAPAEREQRHTEAEAERFAADTWTKATRREVEGEVTVAEDNGFASMGLPEALVLKLAKEGITAPFPIQAATIPDALAGRDVLGRGQTGSGKTLAFGLPTLTRLQASGRAAPHHPKALVLVPTRELAMQVSDALEPLAHVMGLRHRLVAGGLSYEGQIKALARGVDLLIATPGRLTDLLERQALSLSQLEVAILDEADHMADMGFLPDVTGILDQAPEGGQRLLFSATLDNGIDTLVERYLTDPVVHSTNDATASVETMAHHVLLIEPQHKKIITAQVANREGRTVVFVRTKLGADRVAMQLREQGVMAAALHGGLTQAARNRVLGAFRDGSLPVLVATDVAARGIHVDDVSVVLQVDPPADHKDYLHRSGRTARAGEQGTVVTLALPHQRRGMERMLREAGVDTPVAKAVPGDEVLAAAGARPTSGEPIPESQFRRLVDPPQRGGRGGGPRRGGRAGGPRGKGGFRGQGRGRERGPRVESWGREGR